MSQDINKPTSRKELIENIEKMLDGRAIEASGLHANETPNNTIINLARPDGPITNSNNNTILSMKDMSGRIEYHCKDGFCGTCACKLRKGTVLQDNNVIAAVRDDESFLACKSRILSKNIEFESNMGKPN